MTKHRKPHMTRRGVPKGKKAPGSKPWLLTPAEKRDDAQRAAENMWIAAEAIDRPRKPPPTTFIAQRPDVCSRCTKPIVPGDRCHFRPDDGTIVHHHHTHTEPVYDICTRCFMTKPCECE